MKFVLIFAIVLSVFSTFTSAEPKEIKTCNDIKKHLTFRVRRTPPEQLKLAAQAYQMECEDLKSKFAEGIQRLIWDPICLANGRYKDYLYSEDKGTNKVVGHKTLKNKWHLQVVSYAETTFKLKRIDSEKFVQIGALETIDVADKIESKIIFTDAEKFGVWTVSFANGDPDLKIFSLKEIVSHENLYATTYLSEENRIVSTKKYEGELDDAAKWVVVPCE